jgi:surface antigen
MARRKLETCMLVAAGLVGLVLSSPASAAPARIGLGKPAANAAVTKAVPPRKSTPSLSRSARSYGPILQCVTFARDVSGIHISGNANTWWHAAEGRFARGQRPETGAVLNFRSSGGMRLGHVSVVTRVVSPREILVDDANWASPGQRKGMIRRGASVIDVSPANDWTEVRVANGLGSWGRVYPTFGFIYPRGDHRAAERIEIAAERSLPHQGMPGRTAAAPRPAMGWSWVGGTATSQRDPAPAAPPAVRSIRADATAPGATRWAWVEGRAVAID